MFEGAEGVQIRPVELLNSPLANEYSLSDFFKRIKFSDLIEGIRSDTHGQLFGRSVALVLLYLVVQIILILAPFVKIGSPGPVFFIQERVGYKGRSILVPKLRTYTNEPDIQSRRRTPFGRFVRKKALDEIPQIFSIVLGDMQWFGPRPYEKRYLPKELSQKYIDDVLSKTKPGLFSWAVLHRGIASEAFVTLAQINMDAQEIKQRSVLNNMQLLFATAVTIVGFPLKLQNAHTPNYLLPEITEEQIPQILARIQVNKELNGKHEEIFREFIGIARKLKSIGVNYAFNDELRIIALYAQKILEGAAEKNISLEDIAKLVNLKSGTVSQKLYRLREKLKDGRINIFLADRRREDGLDFEEIEEKNIEELSGFFPTHASKIAETKEILKSYIVHVKLMKKMGIVRGRTIREDMISTFLELAKEKRKKIVPSEITDKISVYESTAGVQFKELRTRLKDGWTDIFAVNHEEDMAFSQAFLQIKFRQLQLKQLQGVYQPIEGDGIKAELYEKLKEVVRRGIYEESTVEQDLKTIGLLYNNFKEYFDSHPEVDPAKVELTRDILVRIIRDLFNLTFEREDHFIVVDFFAGHNKPLACELFKMEKNNIEYQKTPLIVGIDNSIPWEKVSSENGGIVRGDIHKLIVPRASVDVVTMINPYEKGGLNEKDKSELCDISYINIDKISDNFGGIVKSVVIEAIIEARKFDHKKISMRRIHPIIASAKRILKPGGRIYIAPFGYDEEKEPMNITVPKRYRRSLWMHGFKKVRIVSPYPDGYPVSPDWGEPSCLIKAQKFLGLRDLGFGDVYRANREAVFNM